MTDSTKGASTDANTQRHLAFTRSFETFGDHFFRYYTRRFKSIQVAEDLCQEFWLSVYRRVPIDKLSEIRLLQKRAKEVAIDYLRKQNTRAFVEFYDEVPDVAGAVSPAEVDSPEAQEAFWALVPDVNLTPEQKTVFWLNRRLGYTIEQIGQKLSIPTSTVGGWISRAVAECKRSLNKES